MYQHRLSISDTPILIYGTERPVKGEFLAGYRERMKAAADGRTAAFVAAEMHRAGWTGSEQTVRRWLDGKREPPFGVLVLLARVLGVDPGWLAFGDASVAAQPTLKNPAAAVSRALSHGAGKGRQAKPKKARG